MCHMGLRIVGFYFDGTSITLVGFRFLSVPAEGRAKGQMNSRAGRAKGPCGGEAADSLLIFRRVGAAERRGQVEIRPEVARVESLRLAEELHTVVLISGYLKGLA